MTDKAIWKCSPCITGYVVEQNCSVQGATSYVRACSNGKHPTLPSGASDWHGNMIHCFIVSPDSIHFCHDKCCLRPAQLIIIKHHVYKRSKSPALWELRETVLQENGMLIKKNISTLARAGMSRHEVIRYRKTVWGDPQVTQRVEQGSSRNGACSRTDTYITPLTKYPT